MGRGSYSAADWSKLKASKNLVSTNGNATEIFKKSKIDPRFDPQFINVREARDSEDHPNSTPIIIGLDVTGSMGYLAEKIATEALHETMMKLYSDNLIEDPAIMFAAYGDSGDSAPLQVTQFESDIRIAEQLLDLWLELCGSGCVVPNFLWYFAAKHTDLDSINKHNKKGFLFTIGDGADIRVQGIGACFSKTFGGDENLTMSTKDILKMAQEKYEVFHIFVDTSVRPSIKEYLPGRTMQIAPTEIDALPEIIISAMLISRGADKEKVLSQWSDICRPIVKKAVSTLTVGNSNKGISF